MSNISLRKYNEHQPSQFYHDFAEKAGCLTDAVTQNSSVFACLEATDTITLQKASANTSLAAKYGQWAFIPVTDDHFIADRPTEQLLNGKVNAERVLVGNNANEGTYFVKQNITTEAQFKSFVQLNYPLLSTENLASIVSLYRVPANITIDSPKYDSNGRTPPYATSISNYAVGWQQAANNLYAETTFVCPAYWLASAYSGDLNPNARDKHLQSWRYQFSPPNAFHGKDMDPLLSDLATPGTKEDVAFRKSFQSIWGNFIVSGDPTLTNAAANITAAGNSSDAVFAASSSSWPPWGKGYALLNLNVTDGEPYRARFDVVDGNAWEGGRGERCALWAKLGAVAKE